VVLDRGVLPVFFFDPPVMVLFSYHAQLDQSDWASPKFFFSFLFVVFSCRNFCHQPSECIVKKPRFGNLGASAWP